MAIQTQQDGKDAALKQACHFARFQIDSAQGMAAAQRKVGEFVLRGIVGSRRVQREVIHKSVFDNTFTPSPFWQEFILSKRS